ncbi:MAG TPA: undecaprenyldiphospho-muramoylpentapeptide beta-N-acetylglucosaminyltransferase [Gammaproteobacteria bacterium]|nr:undecaprenyldiphospho-muramoylpentapeptide beta-N-acetylglucosaminyltransferase [Gammaproteobacteria bacterium]
MTTQRPIMIMAGGTGGHVYPALAVAEELRTRGVPVVWLGTRKGIEARLVPQAGIDIEWLGVTGLRGKGMFSLVLAPFNLLRAGVQAWRIVKRLQPCAVLGMGGFVSGPGGFMAWLLRKPLLIHEQNAIPGLTNKLLARLANVVMEAFPNSFKSAVHVGNPVRRKIATLPSPVQRMKNRENGLHLLVFGGSLGAAVLNEVVPRSLAGLPKELRPQVWHQSGPKNFNQATTNYAQLQIPARIDAYIDNMSEAYDWADLVLCRAGAMTVSEIAAVGVASILVPYPHAVDDHQTANAHYLADAGAAVLLPQTQLGVEKLQGVLADMTREKVLDMANRARRLGMPESTRIVVEQCLQAGGIPC